MPQEMVWHEVTPEMGKVSFQGPSCCKPLKKGPGITAFFKSPGAGGKTGGHGVFVKTTGQMLSILTTAVDCMPSCYMWGQT